MTIPRLSQRVECMLYRRKLEVDIEEIRPELSMVHEACRELRTSKKLKQVLQVRPSPCSDFVFNFVAKAVLTLGNALNGSTFRGGAQGFKLDALMKVGLV